MIELLKTPSLWVFLGYVVIAFFLITNAPELREKRLRFGLSLIALVAFGLVAATLQHPLALIAVIILLRPILFVVGLIWSEVIGHHAGAALDAVTFGDGRPMPKERPSFRFERNFIEMGRHELAAMCLRKKLREHPDSFEGLFLLASLQAIHRKNMPEAAKAIRQIMALPEISEREKEMAQTEYGRWARDNNVPVETFARPALGSDGRPAPKELRGCDLARQQRREGKTREAIETLLQAHARNREDCEPMLHLAAIYGEDLGDLPKAKGWVDKIAALPYAPSGFREYALESFNSWSRKARGAEANRAAVSGDLAGAAESAPEMPKESGHQKALRLRAEGRIGSAVEALDEALRADPSDWESALLLAALYVENCDQYRRGRDLAEKILAASSDADLKKRTAAKLAEWKARVI